MILIIIIILLPPDRVIFIMQGYQSTDGQLTDNTSSSPNGNYRVVIIQGARVFIPNGPIETESTRRDRAVGWINRWDTKIRYWISGVVRED